MFPQDKKFSDVTCSHIVVITLLCMLIAPEIIMADGAAITIDGTNFAGGVKKIIDLNGTESLEGKEIGRASCRERVFRPV